MKRVIISLSSLAWLMVTSCAAKQMTPFLKPAGNSQAEKMLASEALADVRKKVVATRGVGYAIVNSRGRQARVSFAFAAEQTGRARLELYDQVAGVIGIMVLNKSYLTWIDAGSGKKIRYTSTARSMKKILGMAIPPDWLIAILLGQPPYNAAAAQVRMDQHSQRIRAYINETVQMLFENYQNTQGLDFPHQVNINLTRQTTHARLIFKELELNPTLDEELFSSVETN